MNYQIFFASLLVVVVMMNGNVSQAQNVSSTAAPTQNTTTTAINATSSAPRTNSTMAPKNTTTAAPKTTPTTIVTTTAMPDPKYALKSGNLTCIELMGHISFIIPYEMKVAKGKTQNTTITVELPPTVNKIGGNCGSNKSIITLDFFKGWMLEFDFKANENKYYISGVTLKYLIDGNFPNASAPAGTPMTATVAKTNYLKSSKEDYYTCSAKKTMKVDQVTVQTEDFKYKAFNENGDITFTGSASECSEDEDTNSIVPIAVGAALAGLVVIVLIAYLIGRKRTRKTGYESV